MSPKIGNPLQVCSVERSMVTEGRAAGARLVHVANGKLHFTLSESNALDVFRLWHAGTNIGFVSKNGLYTPPDDFPHKFPAGMVYTCGPDAIGGVEGHPVHGRMHAIPAEIREIKADEKGVRIVGEVRNAALFGENLVLTRTIETKVNSDELTITDALCNEGFRQEPYCLLYHVNAGYPLVDEGAKIKGDFVESLPRNEWAAKNAAKMFEVEAPVANFEECCFFHRTKDGKMTIENRKLGKRFTVSSSLKRFVEWKSRASGDFVIGLEPCTCWLDGHLKYATLKPGQRALTRLTLCVEDI